MHPHLHLRALHADLKGLQPQQTLWGRGCRGGTQGPEQPGDRVLSQSHSPWAASGTHANPPPASSLCPLWWAQGRPVRLVLMWRLEVGKHLQKRCKDADPQRGTEKVFLSERAPTVYSREVVQAGVWWGMPKEHRPRAASWGEDGVPWRRPRTKEEEVTAHALHGDGPCSSWTFPLGISFPSCHPGRGLSRGSHEVVSTPRHSAQSRAPTPTSPLGRGAAHKRVFLCPWPAH